MQATESSFAEESFVRDVAVQVDGDEVVITLVVNAATNEATAREALENAARFLASQVAGDDESVQGPSANDLGELWDHYTLNVGAATGTEDFIAQGAKVPGSPRISW